jgi:hypothetical protein
MLKATILIIFILGFGVIAFQFYPEPALPVSCVVDIKIHGLKNGSGYIGRFQRLKDWTDGCIGLTDIEVDELYMHVKTRCSITIIP